MFLKSLFFLLYFVVNLSAQEYEKSEFTSFVKATKFNSTYKKEITFEKIKDSHYQNLTDLLQSELNTPLVQSSFEPTNIYFRGGHSGQVLILLDGVPFYDPTTIQGTVELNNIPISIIKKIIILSGAQSVIYGSSAQNGVILIETFLSDYDKSEQSVYFSTQMSKSKKIIWGYEALMNSQSSLNQNSQFNWSVGLNHHPQISTVEGSKQVYFNQLQFFKIGYANNSFLNGEFKINYLQLLRNQNLSQTDYNTYKLVDAQNYLAKSDIQQQNIQYKKNDIKIILAHTDYDRIYDLALENDVNDLGVNEVYKGQLYHFSIEKNIYNSILGLNYEKEIFELQDQNSLVIDHSQDKFAFYYKQKDVFNVSQLEVGLRLENRHEDDNQLIGQIGYEFSHYSIELASAFKNPTLYQLYSSFGYKDLKSEKSYNLNFNTDLMETFQNIFNLDELKTHRITVYFMQNNDLITTSSRAPYKYENINKTKTVGLEYLIENNDFALNLNYQEPYDVTNRRWLLRRPLLNSVLKIKTYNDDYINSNLEVLYSGPRNDLNFSNSINGEPVKLKEYSLLNLNLNIRLNKDLNTFFRIDNLLNASVENVYGYKQKQTLYKTGVQYSW